METRLLKERIEKLEAEARAWYAAAVEASAEITRLNAAHGQTVFNPVATSMLRRAMEARMKDALAEVEAFAVRQDEGRDLDAGFDGGEFSGPAHDDIFERGVEAIAQRHGVPAKELEVIFVAGDDAYGTDSVHGEGRNT